jgi:Zn-dependent membrane protease YugP
MISSGVLRAFSNEMQKRAVVGTLLTMPVRHLLAQSALKKDPDTARAKKLRKALLKGDKTEVKLLTKGNPIGPHYDRKTENGALKQWVAVRKNEDPAILAHELGHSELDRETVGSILQSKPMRAAAAVGSIAGILAANEGHIAIGAAIAGAAMLPVVTYEGMASKRGLERLQRVGATEEELSAARSKLLKAWGTYASLPVANVGDAVAYGMLSRLGRRG